MRALPLLAGAAMGAMLLAMAHGPVTQGTAPGFFTVVALAHAAVLALLAGLGTLAARLSPRLRGFLSHLHRPSAGHALRMLAAAALAALAIHLVHGGPLA